MAICLVTGATGFVGANLVRYLLRQGETVHVFVRNQSNLWRLEEIRNHIHIHTVDLVDKQSIENALQAIRPEYIYHLAVYGAYSYQTDYDVILNTNIMGTAHLVEAAANIGFTAFINTGSSSEYGFKDHAPAEHERPDPNSYYAVAKVAATNYCQHVARTIQCPIPTLRLYSVYGAYEEPKRLMPTLIQKGLQHELPPLVAPETARDFIYIDDVCEAYWQAAHHGNLPHDAIFNIGSGKQHTLRDVVSVARDVLDIGHEPVWGAMQARAWDTTIWVANMAYTHHTLGWQARVDFPTGFARMVAWFKEHTQYYDE